MRPTLNLVRISGIFKAEQRALFHHRRPSPASLSWQGAPAADCKRKSVGTLPVYSVGTKSIKTGRVPVRLWPYRTRRLEETIRLAITAGNDLAMICHRLPAIEEAHQILQAMPAAETERALAGVAKFKAQMHPQHAFSEEAFKAIDSEIWDLRVAVLGPQRAAQRSPEDGKRSPVEVY